MINKAEQNSLISHLKDLKENSQKWHKTLCSSFLNEEEQAEVKKIFPPSSLIRYEGGYPDARRRKIIFFCDEGDDFSDIVCMKADIDQRFRKITHRDVLGAVMHLQVDRGAVGDLWVEDHAVYMYTSASMTDFFAMNLTHINQLSVSFHSIPEHPAQIFKTKQFSCVIAANRLDAVVAGLTHLSRAKAKDLIHEGSVQVNHALVEQADKLCDNNDTISIRGTGRFVFLGETHETKSGRIAAKFLQYI